LSAIEALVIAVCLITGYWIVSKMLSRPPQDHQACRRKPDEQSFDGEPPWTFPQDTDSTPWSKVLGVDPAATAEEIRAAYKVRRSEYHPDKVAALGEELRALAERKSKEIGMAYRRGMRERGVSEQLW
jgi:DnaJ-domain-containing protein 1